MSAAPDARALVELVRLPSVLTVPGDVLAGAAWAARDDERLPVVRPAVSSSLLYLAGMALNDYADREVDARERPQRPIPSGRVEPGFALGLAGALSAAGLLTAASVRCPPKATLALTATVWAYDLVLKQTRAGPPAMAAARLLDVLSGAPAGRARDALPVALLVGGHTLLITIVSASEVRGGTAELARGALAGTALVCAAAAALALARARTADAPASSAGIALALLAVHAATVGGAERAAADLPSAANVGRVVGAGILGMLPLQGAALAGAGRRTAAAGVGLLWPVARRLARRTAVT